MHILVAEDDKVSRELLRRMLETEQRHVLVLAADGEEAWKLLSDPASAFGACILDIQMPGVDGLELAGRIRADARLARLPIILCTAANDRATVRRAAGLAVSGYIVKPYTRSRVVEKLAQIEGGASANPAEPSVGTLEESAVVCQRLGIDADTHRALLQAMLGDMREWTARLRNAPAAPELEKLLMQANGLKGASLSLGAMRAAQLLEKIQSPSPAPVENRGAALDALEKEIVLLDGRLGVPSAA
jgi:two-component system chemotaxis response regulator CheY